MKTRRQILCGNLNQARRAKVPLLILAVILALAFITCGDGPGTDSDTDPDTDPGTDSGTDPGTGPGTDPGGSGGGNTPPAGTTVPGSTLAEKLAWVLNENNVQNGGTYTITVNADEAINPQTLSYTNRSNVTINLWGGETERVVSLKSSGTLFSVFRVTLVLDNNITLEGNSDDTGRLVSVTSVTADGKLEMRAGAKITGNTGGGVSITGPGASFTMSGGTISGNTASQGGGVHILGSSASFTMSGGTISGNTASLGGGVAVGGTFNMSGGTITGNIVSSEFFSPSNGDTFNGGGVYVIGNGAVFTMTGGTISGNTAEGSASINQQGNGGGVFVYNGGTFRIVNGTVHGSDAASGMKNAATNNGAALYVRSGNPASTAERGTFNGTTWNSAGSLSTTGDTIRIVNGELQ